MKTTIIGSGKTTAPQQTIGRPVDTDPVFFKKDLSGRDGHYSIFLSDLIHDESEHEDDEEFIEWAENAEIGDEYTEFHNKTYTRTS